MQLYPKSQGKKLEDELFLNPTNEYRAVPFWGWNCRLDEELLKEQITYFQEMGFGGFLMHPRVGLDTEYLGDEFVDSVKLCVNEAAEKGMFGWLYDEDRYPSGFAGGLVTKDRRYRARHLLFTCILQHGFSDSKEVFELHEESECKYRGYYLAAYDVKLESGYLTWYSRRAEGAKPEGTKRWYAYMELDAEEAYYNGQTYLDVLNPKAVRTFITVTHKRYQSAVGQEFGKSIPAIFTDEPRLCGPAPKWVFHTSEKDTQVTIPFTDDLPETYERQCGISLMDVLPELFWEKEDKGNLLVRYHFFNHIADRFTDSFAGQIGQWCEEHNLYASGHVMGEDTLFSQATRLGDCMRLYSKFQLPGIDVLKKDHPYTTVKQVVSAARQYGRDGVLCELYGATDWDFDFKGHKLQGDWQAALGITVRVPHMAWLSMAGEAKRDWPASINYQSPWYKEYPYIENHFARLNTALTRGNSIVHVGVIHPIESFWLSMGANDKTAIQREEYETRFQNLVEWMTFGMIDFDFISEALLPELTMPEKEEYPMVGKMRYQMILVPECITLRESTVQFLERFQKAGGKVIVVGNAPRLLCARPSKNLEERTASWEQIPFERSVLMDQLQSIRDIEIRDSSGKMTKNLLYQLRQDGDVKWLFISHVFRKNQGIEKEERYNLRIKGHTQITLYDTMTGGQREIEVMQAGTETHVKLSMYAEDSLLLKLFDGDEKQFLKEGGSEAESFMETILEEPSNYQLEEPNVLLLDQAEYCFDHGPWQKKDEILRIDSKFRKKLNMDLRGERMMQPWAMKNRGDDHTLSLRFTVDSTICAEGVELALEQPENVRVTVNGTLLSSQTKGWYVDKAIHKIPIPELQKGKNIIILDIRFHEKTNVEHCYLLGQFGVEVRGSHSVITELPKKLYFGDFSRQGFPFYGGNFTMKCPFFAEQTEKGLQLELSKFFAPLVGVGIDGERIGIIAFAPHRLCLPELPVGSHVMELTVMGNRFNTFGALHNANDEFEWPGPYSYRTEGNEWTAGYQTRPVGILNSPVIRRTI